MFIVFIIRKTNNIYDCYNTKLVFIFLFHPKQITILVLNQDKMYMTFHIFDETFINVSIGETRKLC